MTAPWTPAATHSANQAGNGSGGGGDDREVHFLGDGGDVRVGLDAENARAFGVDGINGALEAAAAHVLEDRAADAAFVFGGADDGDDLGGEDGIERMAANLVQDVVSRFEALVEGS